MSRKSWSARHEGSQGHRWGQRGAPLSLGATVSVPGLIAKIVFLGLALGLSLSVLPALLALHEWAMLTVLVLALTALFVIYTTKRFIPGKYLFPGTFFLALFILLPVLYTVQISTTNYGDGTRTSKAEAIDSIIADSVKQDDQAPTYTMSVAAEQVDGRNVLFLVDDNSGRVYRGTASGLVAVSPSSVRLEDGKVRAADGYTILEPSQVNQLGTQVSQLSIPVDRAKGLFIHPSGISSAFTGQSTLVYRPSSDTIVSRLNGQTYRPALVGDREFFVDARGTKLSSQSWLSNVGLLNYTQLFANPQIRGQLAATTVWTLAFALFSVGGTFLCGLLIALLFNDERMAGRKVWRAAMVIPYAVPTFIGFLIWSTFFNKDFGIINQLTGLGLDWFGNPSLAKLAVLMANLWAGIPYMFLISTGALQSLPGDVIEAARIDGAGPLRMFFQVKLPLLLVSVAPLLVASFAFNFNNYNAIALMTKGGPFQNSGQLFGGTDILISGIYRLAFGGSGAQFGLAAAVSVLLFLVTAVMAAAQFRFTRSLEDVG